MHVSRMTLAALALLAAVPGHRAAAQTTIDGGQTLNISSDTTYSSGLIVGNSSTGTVNQTGGTVSANSTSPFTLGNNAGSSGTYNLSGGTLNFAGQFNVGNSGQGIFVQSGNSTVNTTTLNLQTGTNCNYSLGGQGVLNITSLMSVKLGNTYTQTGGTATVGSTFRVYGTSTASISGGSLSANSTSTTNFGNLVGWYAGTGPGTLNLSGTSALTASKGIFLGTVYTSGSTYNGTGTYNLDGGTLTTTTITPGTGSSGATLNLNGGTLAASAASTTFISGLTVANVRNGGASIDSGTNAITIPQALVHSTMSGDNATDGGLTKLGAGTLTLTAANTYTGVTTISAGTLALDNAAGRALTASSIVVNGGGAFVTAGTAATGVLSLGTVNQLAATGGVTLSGGTVAMNGNSQGASSGTAVGTTATAFGAGALRVDNAAQASYLDFGANQTPGTKEVFSFSGYDFGAGTLYIENYVGNAFTGFATAPGGGQDQLFFGAGGQYADQQLRSVFFVNPNGTTMTYQAHLLGTGQVVAPEPSQAAALGLGVLGLAGLALKARRRQAA